MGLTPVACDPCPVLCLAQSMELEVPDYRILQTEDGGRVAINPDLVASLAEVAPGRVFITLPSGGPVIVAKPLEHVIALLRGARVAEE
jgi:hypothetical protein